MQLRTKRPAMLVCIATLCFWTYAHRDLAPLNRGKWELLFMAVVAVVLIASSVLAVAAAREGRWMIVAPLAIWIAGIWLRLGAVPYAAGVWLDTRAADLDAALPRSLLGLLKQLTLTTRWATGLVIGSLIIGWLAEPTSLLRRVRSRFRRGFHRRFDVEPGGALVYWPYGRHWAPGRLVPDPSLRPKLWRQERALWLVLFYFTAFALLCRGLAGLSMLYYRESGWWLGVYLASVPMLVVLLGGTAVHRRHRRLIAELPQVPAMGAIADRLRRAGHRRSRTSLTRGATLALLIAASLTVVAAATQVSGHSIWGVIVPAAIALPAWLSYLWCKLVLVNRDSPHG